MLFTLAFFSLLGHTVCSSGRIGRVSSGTFSVDAHCAVLGIGLPWDINQEIWEEKKFRKLTAILFFLCVLICFLNLLVII